MTLQQRLVYRQQQSTCTIALRSRYCSPFRWLATNPPWSDMCTAKDSEGTPTAQLRAMIRNFVLGHTTRHTTARVVNYELAALTREHRSGD